MRVVVLGLCLAMLAGCVTARNTITATDSEGRRAFLTYAGGETPVYLVAANPPADLGTHAAVASRLADAASGAVFGMDTEFTSDIDMASRSNFRIVALFDPTVALSTTEVCRSEARQSPLVAARHADKTTLFLAFCTRGEDIAGTIVTGPKVVELSDPALTKMVRTGIREMFSFDDRRNNRDEPPILGSIAVTPSVGFRLNPLTGIWD